MCLCMMVASSGDDRECVSMMYIYGFWMCE